MTLSFWTFFLALAAGLAGEPTSQGGAEWRYVVPAAGEAFDHAPLRALVLSREKPLELVEKVAYQGEPALRRYAMLRFGSASSTRVTVVVDRDVKGNTDLFLDADRNLRIDDRDRVSATKTDAGDREKARTWRLALDVALVENETVRRVPRAVVFRLGASGQTLGFATAGYLEGNVVLGRKNADAAGKKQNQPMAARRVDGDGNGFMADAQDRLFLDLNGDGRFDPAGEQFLFATILNLEGARTIVRSDLLGTRLQLDPLEGTGTLRLELKPKEAKPVAKVAEMRATVLGRDGSVFGLTGGEPTTVPAGEYRMGNLTIALEDAKSGEVWTFNFSDGLWSGEPRWYKVGNNAAVAIDPIGKPRFELRRFESEAMARPGDDVTVRPALYTGDGLLIIVGYCGRPISPATQELLGARIVLLKKDGVILATANSGFS
jgi:hypothetical protein